MMPPPEVDDGPAADTADEGNRLVLLLLIAVLVERRGLSSRNAPALVLANRATNNRSMRPFL